MHCLLLTAYRLRELLPLLADDPLLRPEDDELRELEPLLRDEEPLYDLLLDDLDELVLRERLDDTLLEDLVLLDDLLLVVGRDMLLELVLVLRDVLDVDRDVEGALYTEPRDRDVRELLVLAVLPEEREVTGRRVIVLREERDVPVERCVLTVPLFSVLPLLRRVISRDDARAVVPVPVLRTRDADVERALLVEIAEVLVRSILLFAIVEPRCTEAAERAVTVRDVPVAVRPLLIARAEVASLLPILLDVAPAMAYRPLRALPLVTEALRDV